MRSTFDERVVSKDVARVLRACQERAWLLGQFPLEPLPAMLTELTLPELAKFRDSLRERFRKLAVPD